MLIQYVRDSKRQKIGALVAIHRDGKIIIGHSKWNKKADKYSPKLCIEVAKARAEKDSKEVPALSIFPAYSMFLYRARKYFKCEEVSDNTLIAGNIAGDRASKNDHRKIDKWKKKLLAKKEKAVEAESAIEVFEDEKFSGYR